MPSAAKKPPIEVEAPKDGEETPPVDASTLPKKNVGGRPKGSKTRPDAPSKTGELANKKEAKKPAAKMPIPKALTDGIADAPFIAAGMWYGQKFKRPLIIPGAGELKAKVMGKEQLREFYEASHVAWDEMMKDMAIELPPWIVWLMSCGLCAGGAILLDQLEMAKAAIAKLPDSEKEKLRAQGFPLPVEMGASPDPAPAPVKPPLTVVPPEPAPITIE